MPNFFDKNNTNMSTKDIYQKLTMLSKVGMGRTPQLKPSGLDAPVKEKHRELLKIQFTKAAQDYYTRLTQPDPDLMRAYEDFNAMEYTPEIASALDIYADECLTKDELGRIVQIHTENSRIKRELEILFDDILELKKNLWTWTRSMCKYGNHYILLDIDENQGIKGYMPLPVREIKREEAYDGNLNSHKFIWENTSAEFDGWQIAHLRLESDERRWPYGMSILETIRRTWKQLTLSEDAMIVYRITRAPERRVFKIDVGNIDPKDVNQYLEKVKRELKKAPVVSQTTGNYKWVSNPVAVDEDYFIAIRGDKSSEIDTLPGASNLDEIADIEFLQKKMFAGLKIPKAFLTYEEDLNAKATLSGQDFRFARTINRVQQSLLSALQTIALRHLYTIGFRDREQLNSFELSLTSPNTQLEIEQMELWQQKAGVFRDMWDGNELSPISFVWGMRNIFGFTDLEIRNVLKQQFIEGKIGADLAEIAGPAVDGPNGPDAAGGGPQTVNDLPSANESKVRKVGSKPNMFKLSEEEFEKRMDEMFKIDGLKNVPKKDVSKLATILEENDNMSTKTLQLLDISKEVCI